MKNGKIFNISRRQFLVQSASVSAGLTLGVYLTGCSEESVPLGWSDGLSEESPPLGWPDDLSCVSDESPPLGWSDGLSCVGDESVVVKFTKAIVFTEGTAANGVTITATGGKAFTLSGSGATGSGSQYVTYQGTWNAAIVSGDVITWTYDTTMGDYVYTSDTAIAAALMRDSFTGVVGNLASHAPDILQVGEKVWCGSVTPELDGSGNLIYPATTNNQVVNYDIGKMTCKITTRFRYVAGANTNAQAGVRVRGTTFNDCVVAQVTANNFLKILKRIGGAETSFGSIALTIDPKTAVLTYEVTDDGTNVTVRCVEDDISLSTNVPTDDLTHAADNFVGLDYGNVPVANQIIYESFDVDTLEASGIALPSSSLVLTNCIDRVLPSPERFIDFISPVADGLTFTRTDTAPATYWDNEGVLQTAVANERRYEFDPLTGQPLGLLLESKKSNLLPNSNDFTLWGGTSTITANDALSPDGMVNASKCEQVGGTLEPLEESFTIKADSLRHIASMHVLKSANAPCVLSLMYTDGTSKTHQISLNPTTGDVADIGADAPVTFGVEESSLCWRVWVIGINDGTHTALTYRFNPTVTAVAGYQHIYGAQLEKQIGSSTSGCMSSYIPTSGGSATRWPDVLTEDDISSWFNDGQPGTLQCTISLPRRVIEGWAGDETAFLVGPHIFDGTYIFNGGLDKRVWFTMRPDVANKQMRFKVDQAGAGVNQSVFNASWYGRMNHAASWNQTRGMIYRDGVAGAEDLSDITIPTGLKVLYFGLPEENITIDGHIQYFSYFNTRLTDAELAIISAG